jgi:hypothetical protein
VIGAAIGGGGSNFCGSSYVFLPSLSKSRGVAEVFFSSPSSLRDSIGDKRYFCRPEATSSYFPGSSCVVKVSSITTSRKRRDGKSFSPFAGILT